MTDCEDVREEIREITEMLSETHESVTPTDGVEAGERVGSLPD